MNEFWNLILVSFFVTNSLDTAESVQLEELPLQIFDEIFGEGWWDNGKDEEWHKLTLEQNFLHQIDGQNTQIGQIEPNSTDQNPPLTEPDQLGQIEPNSNENIAKDERKRQIVAKFHVIKDEFKKKGKYSKKERTQIENKIAKHFKVNRSKIYKWKKEFGLSRKKTKNERKNLIEQFDQRKDELKRDGFKNSHQKELDKTVAKELGLSFGTISNWKSKLGQTTPQHKHPHNEQKKLMKCYYEIKDKNPKISDADIAKTFKIGTRTLYTWKSQLKRQQFYPNSVEENAAANAQQIGNSNSGSI